MIKCSHKTCHACYSKDYESVDIRFLYEFISKHEKAVFLDIGAHVGLYIYRLNEMLDKTDAYHGFCEMISVEPEFAVLDTLRSNIAPCQVIPMAAWDRCRCLYLSKQGKEIGRIVVQQVDATDDPIVGINLDMLDKRALVFAAKIDVEGSEHRAVIGLRKTLDNSKAGALVIELSEGHLRRYGSSVDNLVDDLKVLGYKCAEGEQQKIGESREGYKRNVHFVKG